MDEELGKKVKHDLEKSGFRSEMNVIRCFSQNNWTCEGSGAYFDRDECKTREIDAIGCHHLRREVSEGLYAASWFYVVAEVKRSDKPWVVFRQSLSRSPLPPMDAWNNLAHCAGPTWLRVQLAEAISGHSLLCDLGWRGYSLHESFKPPDKSSTWHAAFVSAGKAAHHLLVTHSKYDKQRQGKGEDSLYFPAAFLFMQPVVVLDGQLLSADLDQDGEVVIGEIPHAPFQFRFQSRRYRRSEYRVDLVQIDRFAAYLERCQKRQAQFFEAYCAILRLAIDSGPNTVSPVGADNPKPSRS
jgi:hypothetical protein